jgi:thioredoxin-like negative regulator of GroEL
MSQEELMAEKSARRQMLEASLAEDPADPFLRYGLALQCLREGDQLEGRERLLALLADHPEDQVAAYQQLGQSFLESEEFNEAGRYLRLGIEKARARGDWHAESEMQGLLAQLG